MNISEVVFHNYLSPNIIVNVPYNNNANNYKDNHNYFILK